MFFKVGGVLFLVAIAINTAVHWKGTVTYGDATLERYNPYGPQFGRALTRALPALSLSFGAFLLSALLGEFAGAGLPVGLKALNAVLLLIGGVALLLTVCVALFNQPKFIVAPRFREEPGPLAKRGHNEDR